MPLEDKLHLFRFLLTISNVTLCCSLPFFSPCVPLCEPTWQSNVLAITAMQYVQLAVSQLDTAVQYIQLAVSQLHTAVQYLQLAVSQLDTAVQYIQLAVSQLDTAVQYIQLAVSQLDTAVQYIQLAVSQLHTAVQYTQLAVSQLDTAASAVDLKNRGSVYVMTSNVWRALSYSRNNPLQSVCRSVSR